MSCHVKKLVHCWWNTNKNPRKFICQLWICTLNIITCGSWPTKKYIPAVVGCFVLAVGLLVAALVGELVVWTSDMCVVSGLWEVLAAVEVVVVVGAFLKK